MEGPPPARAPLGRPTVLTDLPADVLAYILSFIPFEERVYSDYRCVVVSRFVSAAACTALAAAARPPSAAWTDVDIPGRLIADYSSLQAASVAAQNALRDAMARAVPSVRHLSILSPHLPVSPARIVAMAAPAAPFLKELKLDIRNEGTFSWVDPILAAATGLTRLEINKFCFEGPPPMIAAGRAAIIAFRNDVSIAGGSGPSANFSDGLLTLLRSVSATSTPGVGVEPPVLVRLDALWVTPRLRLEQAGFVREFTSVFGRHLTRLGVRGGTTAEDLGQLRDPDAHAEARTAVARLLENRALPALRELVNDWRFSSIPLDLAGVHAPPPGLTFLSMNVRDAADVLLSPAIRAGLASLAMACGTFRMVDPPQCLRGAGGSFSRLTRLVYGSRGYGNKALNLAVWGRPEYSVPTLVQLEAGAIAFTLEGWDRRSWRESFLAGLPRLARLMLWAHSQRGPFRATYDGSTGAAAVQNTITARLPQAARESGRRLDVAVHQSAGDPAAFMDRFGWGVVSHPYDGFELALTARPPG
jgi:hypothetical protein